MVATNKTFGNLNFSSYTVETAAERYILALQAALLVQGYTPTHPTMKKVLRLKRSMSRNKVRRYTFDLVQAAAPAPAQAPSPLPSAEDGGEILIPLLESLTGLSFRSKETVRASSGHFLVKFSLEGPRENAKMDPGSNQQVSASKLREAIASEVASTLGTSFSSFSVQPLRIRMDKGVIDLSVQCIYRA